jgi:hypothetical protein
MRTEVRTDMKKLIFAFRNFSKEPKNKKIVHTNTTFVAVFFEYPRGRHTGPLTWRDNTGGHMTKQ